MSKVSRFIAVEPFLTLARQAVGIGRYRKRAILAANDAIILSFALWLGFSMRYGEWFFPPSWQLAALMALAPFIAIVSLFNFGVYRIVTRFMGGRAINPIAGAILLSVLVWALVVFLSGVTGVPRIAVFIYTGVGITGVWGSRQIVGWVLRSAGIAVVPPTFNSRISVLVYGAGQSGILAMNALERSGRYAPFSFVDPNPTLWGQYIQGYKVHRPDRVAGLVERHAIKEVVVTLSDVSRRQLAEILQELGALPVKVRKLPVLDDIASGRVTIQDLRPFEAADLLGRDPVPPNNDLLSRNISGKSVMVTGAGGSIGSELVRQIINQRPQRLVLVDISETGLFEIDNEVRRLLQRQAALDTGAATDAIHLRKQPSQTTVVQVLGSIANAPLMAETMKAHGVETVYHAAAYKHVPIVEANLASGFENNTFATETLARTARDCRVKRFVLISTDKAVRPRSMMGASKRLAEMCLQSLAAEGTGPTVFTMVRFGNVLDSSGSVVRTFRRQIEAGGPVTVTDREMVRYFMSIPEAAMLVIQAGAMATGGEVFVLDMGEPVRIDDLARTMIRLSGLEVHDIEHPDGDIAIEYIGLRPGEKLKEELLIGSDATGTEHPRIRRLNEPMVSRDLLITVFAEIRTALAVGDQPALRRAVEGLIGSDRLNETFTPRNPGDRSAVDPAAEEPSDILDSRRLLH